MTRTLKVDNITISDASDCFVIAEIGNNHQGDLQKAMECLAIALQVYPGRTITEHVEHSEIS